MWYEPAARSNEGPWSQGVYERVMLINISISYDITKDY